MSADDMTPGDASPDDVKREIEQLAALCERLGAPPAQAAVMAGQLHKRAGQLAAERGTTPATELKRLLELVVKGRSGEVPKDFSPTATAAPLRPAP